MVWSSSILGGPTSSYCAYETESSGETHALTPTATAAGYKDPYYSPVLLDDFADMVTAQYGCFIQWPFPSNAQEYATALTETTTIYDDQVHSQITKEADEKATSPARATAVDVSKATKASSSASAGAPKASSGASQTASAGAAEILPILPKQLSSLLPTRSHPARSLARFPARSTASRPLVMYWF